MLQGYEEPSSQNQLVWENLNSAIAWIWGKSTKNISVLLKENQMFSYSSFARVQGRKKLTSADISPLMCQCLHVRELFVKCIGQVRIYIPVTMLGFCLFTHSSPVCVQNFVQKEILTSSPSKNIVHM
jgi:hypothetical protein